MNWALIPVCSTGLSPIPRLVGQGFSLQASSAAVLLGAASSLQMDNFTIEMWVQRSATSYVSSDGPSANAVLFGYGTGGYAFALHPDGTLFLTEVGYDENDGSARIPADTGWYHVAVTKFGETVWYYVDGQGTQGPAYSPKDSGFSFSTDAAIGARGDSPHECSFYGTIAQPSIYGRALSSSEILAIYNAAPYGKCPLPPPSGPCDSAPANMVSWWEAESNALDSVGDNNGTGVPYTSYAPGAVGTAFSFSQTHAAVLVGNSNTLQLRNFTIEGWIRRYDSSYGWVSSEENYNAVLFGWGSGGFAFAMHPDGTLFLTDVDESQGGDGPSVTNTDWHHVAVTSFNGSNACYVDGVGAPFNYNPWYNFTTATGAAIGARGDSPYDCSFSGEIDEMTIYSRALTSNEIWSIYAAGSGGKCPSASPPYIITQPLSQTNSYDSEVTFSVVAGGTGPLSYQWYLNGGSIGGANASSYYTTASTGAAGSYYVVVGNSAGSVTSSTATLSVYPYIMTQPQGQTVPSGVWVTFSVSAGGSATLSFQWYLNGGSISGATASSYSTNAGAGTAGTYAVVVANACGSVTSSTAVLSIGSFAPGSPVSGYYAWWNPDSNVVASGSQVTSWTSSPNGFTLTASGSATPILSTLNGHNIISFNPGASSFTNYLTFSSSFAPNMTNCVLFLALQPAAYMTTHTSHVIIDRDAYGWIFNADYGGGSLYQVRPGTVFPTCNSGQYEVVTNWQIWAVTYNSSNSSYAAWTNGTLLYSNGWADCANYTLSSVYFGAGSASGPIDYSGYLADIIIYTNQPNIGSMVASNTAYLTNKYLGPTPPSITNQPQSQTNSYLSSVTFSVGATGTAPLFYQWRFNGGSISGATNSSYSTSASTANAGSYAVVVTNSAGSIASSNAILWVYPYITTSPPQTLATNNGVAVTFSVSAGGSAPLFCQWQFNGNNIANATNTSYSITANTTTAGNYAVVVTNSVGSANATVTLLIVPYIITGPQSLTNTNNAPVTFGVSAGGSAPLSYQWLLNNNNITGATTSSYTTNASAATAGTYTVDVANSGGSTNATATLSLLPYIITQPQNQTVPYGTDATFSVAATPLAPLSLSLSYQWYFDGGSINGATSSSYTVTNATNAGNYSVIVIDSNGPTTSSNAMLSVPPNNPSNVRLGYWKFNNTNYASQSGANPTLVNNVVTNSSFSGTAASFTATNATLRYNVVETNRSSNFNWYNGSVRFWFQPSWNSGSAPPNARILTAGFWPNADWTLQFVTNGSYMALTTVSNDFNYISDGKYNTWIPINFQSNLWNQIALTYSPSNIALYLNGALAATCSNAPLSTNYFDTTNHVEDFGVGNGLLFYPKWSTYESNGFSVGGAYPNIPTESAINGQIDELETFNYPLTAQQIAAGFPTFDGASNVMLDTDYVGRSDLLKIYVDGITNINDPTQFVGCRLGYWRFDTNEGPTTYLFPEQGQMPVSSFGVSFSSSWSGTALNVGNSPNSSVTYPDVYTNGWANINCRQGTVRLWIKPNWSSGSGGGAPPVAPLIYLGNATNPPLGEWSLQITNGTTLELVSASNNITTVNVSTNFTFASTNWMQIVATYGSTGCALYVNGAPAGSGTTAPVWPTSTDRANGMVIGNTTAYNSPANCQFDEIETFNYQLPPSNILANFQLVAAVDSNLDGIPDLLEDLYLGGTSQPYLGAPVTVAGAVKAEQFDQGGQSNSYYSTSSLYGTNPCRNTGMFITNCNDLGGGYCLVGHAGEWVNYSINVLAAQAYTVEARMGGFGSNGTFQFSFSNASFYTNSAVLSNTTTSWASISSTNIWLPKGTNVMQLALLANGSDDSTVGLFNYISIYPYWTPPTPGATHPVLGLVANSTDWGDAVTNAERIQSVINGLDTNFGGTVLITNTGNIYVSQLVTTETGTAYTNAALYVVGNNVTIQGAGTNTTLIGYNRATTVIYVTDDPTNNKTPCGNFTLRDLTIEAQPHVVFTLNTGGSYSTNWESGALNVSVPGPGNSVVVGVDKTVGYCYNILFTNCQFLFGNYPIVLNGGVSNVLVRDCDFTLWGGNNTPWGSNNVYKP